MLGPGEYVPDVTEGIASVGDLPKPRLEYRSRPHPPPRRAPRIPTARRAFGGAPPPPLVPPPGGANPPLPPAVLSSPGSRPQPRRCPCLPAGLQGTVGATGLDRAGHHHGWLVAL